MGLSHSVDNFSSERGLAHPFSPIYSMICRVWVHANQIILVTLNPAMYVRTVQYHIEALVGQG